MKITHAGASQQFIKIFLYGTLGTGKTTFAVSALDYEETKDALFISLEKGEKSVEDRGDNLPVISVESFADFKSAFAIATECVKTPERTEQLFGKRYNFKTIVVDGIQDLIPYILDDIHGIKGNQKVDTDYLMKYSSIDDPNWISLQNAMHAVMKAIRGINAHVVITCAAKESINKQKQTCYKPAMVGQLATQVPHACDLSGFVTMVNTSKTEEEVLEQRIYIKPIEDRFLAKNRLPQLRNVTYLVNPQMQDLFKEQEIQA